MQADAGVMFVGPNSYAIQSMGDKIESKRIATKAKVNLIPGFDGEISDENHALEVANDIGAWRVIWYSYMEKLSSS